LATRHRDELVESPLGFRLELHEWARRPRRGWRSRALADEKQGTRDRGEPRVVVRREIDDDAAPRRFV
jgi:hypothetical protein